MKVAIMQPYFFPYAGYFRLFAAADLFVVLDCVQFPRRGWVHRNQLTDHSGQKQWLTLPLQKADRDSTRICDLRFPEDALESLETQFRKFPAIGEVRKNRPDLYAALTHLTQSPTEYLCETLAWQTAVLGISRPMLRSSTLPIDPRLRAQDRIIAIAKHVGATDYINAPGGRELYEGSGFDAAGLALHFLSGYEGSFDSMLARLAREESALIAAEIQRNTRLERATTAVAASGAPVAAGTGQGTK